MLNKSKLIALCGYLLCIFPVGYAMSATDKQVDNIVGGLNSESPGVAETALADLEKLIDKGEWKQLAQDKQNQIIQGFIKELEHGAILARNAESDDAFQHLRLLGRIAGKLKNPKTIPALIKGLPWEDFEDVLVKIGKPAIEPIFGGLESKIAYVKLSCISILEKMRISGKLSVENQQRFKATLENLAKNGKDQSVRRAAAYELGDLGDAGTLPLLTTLSENDTSYYQSKRTGIKSYLVREAAQEAVKKVKDRLVEEEKQQKKLQKSTTAQ